MEFLSKGRWRIAHGVGCVALVCLPAAAATRTTRRPMVLSAWEQAQRGREELEAREEGTRTRAGYARVLDGFRAIYHDNPRDSHAAEAVNAVAEVLAAEGREFEDAKTLRAAVGQYEFLRKEYPGSSLRGNALLAEGRIEVEDLGDGAAAREKFLGVVRESPGSESGRAAKAELAGLRLSAAPTHRDRTAMKGARGELGLGDDGKQPQEQPQGQPQIPSLRYGMTTVGGAGMTTNGGVGMTTVGEAGVKAKGEVPAAPHTIGAVTGIRHWSTPTYTRVAIDVGDEVTFEAARVPNPDRIYFDLHGARLGAELVGKSFDVTDDGFLKRIRAAQAGGDVTRVVLDVNGVTEYSAFLLPNPYRLIIDIHGVKPVGTKAKEAVAEVPASAVREASAAANASGLPAMAPTDGGEAVRPAGRTPKAVTQQKAVPNAVAKPGSAGEVAAVSDAPGRVEATRAPTSKPIAAVVRPITLGDSATKVGAGSAAGGNGRAALDNPPYPVKLDRMGHPVSPPNDVVGPVRAADKTADGQTSLVRALGLKIGRIVIDAGHGGHDSGTLGVDGIEEKDVVLDVALRLGKLLHERLGAEIVYTRSDDTFIPLETRTAIANKAQADLFLSIHANSSQDESARGVETYYLNFTSDNAALEVAARENAVGGQSIHQLSDLVKKIALKDKIAESREFAADVEGSLYAGLEKGNGGLKNRGVKKAPFVVLIGANMPSILAEISFVTNARDAAQLREPEYRQRVAESLYTGVAKYENGLAGSGPQPVVRVAAAGGRGAGTNRKN